MNSNGEDNEPKDDSKSEYKVEKDPRILRYRKLLRVAGLFKYFSLISNTKLNEMKSNNARYNYLKQIFIDNGITKLSIETCKRFKEKQDRQKEIDELDMNNIIDNGRSSRPTRSQARQVIVKNKNNDVNPYVKLNKANLKESDDEEISEDDEAIDPLKNLRDLIGSDESEEERKPKRRIVRVASDSE